MTDALSNWRMDRPTTCIYTSALTDQPTCPIRTYLPRGYVRSYAYPLLVLFHGANSDADQVLKLAPQISDQNFVMISLPIPEQKLAPSSSNWTWDSDTPADTVWEAIRQTRRTYKINRDKVFLVGINGGCQAAYQTAFDLGNKVAGVVALNGGPLTRQHGQPLFRWDLVRQLKVLISRNQTNHDASQVARLFDIAGAQVTLRAFQTTQELPTAMLSNVNHWVMDQIINTPARKTSKTRR
jgi:phospholipase/carboxylesterase